MASGEIPVWVLLTYTRESPILVSGGFQLLQTYRGSHLFAPQRGNISAPCR